MFDFVHEVRLEDIPLCESVQRGLHSRGYGTLGKGHLLVRAEGGHMSEHALYDFQRKVRRALT